MAESGTNATLTGYEAGTAPVTVSSPFGPIAGITFGAPSQEVVNQIFGLPPGTTSANGVPNNSTFLLNPDGTLFVGGRSAGRDPATTARKTCSTR